MERTDLDQWKSREVARLLTLVETQRRYYQEIVASLPIGLLVLSSDLGVILANAAARKMLGLRDTDSLQRRLDAFFPRWVLDRVEQVLNTGATQTGIMVDHLRISILAMRSWDNDAVQEALISVEDLSGVRPAAPAVEPVSPAASQVMEGQLQPADVIANLEAVTWAVDVASLNFVFVSPRAKQLLGFEVESWARKSFWSDRIYVEDRDSVLQSYRRAIDKRESYSGEFRALTADGRVVWLRESARLLADPEGRPQYLIGITVDATERRLLEDQLVQSERVEAVSKLASRMAHDLNNMLMILTGYGEELLNTIPAASPMRSDIQEILNATERISGLASQLLSFTRKQVAGAETVQLEAFLSNAGPRLRERFGGPAGLELQLSTVPNRINVNAAQLEQVVMTVIDRARHLMSSQVKITIETARLDIHEDVHRSNSPLQPGAYAAIDIRVPGPTPQGDARASLFECLVPGKEPWDETAAAVSRAYGVLHQWGGDLVVLSGAQGECIYRILLPRTETPVPQAAAPELQAPPEPEPHRATILVVEDEAGIRALVRKILRRQNYEVIEAANGEEALAICRDNPAEIDLLITDVIMPQMGGRDLADRLREQGRVMRVLFVSGYTDDATIYSGQLPPGSAFLQKPFTLGSLLDKVREVLAEKLT